jgi:hypothetical protein
MRKNPIFSVQRLTIMVLLLHFVVFLVFKIIRFDTLNYVSNDMTMNIEAAFSWLNGRPFSYNNILGRLDHDHNYWILGALLHICYYLGAYGVFLVQLGLTFLALLWASRKLEIAQVPLTNQIAFGLGFLVCPTYLWLIDHPGTGWVIEFLVFPACLFFVLGLLSDNRWVFWLSAVFLMSIREESAVLGFYLHTAYWIHRYEQQGMSFGQMLRQRKLWTVAATWAALFVLSVLYLIWINEGKGTMGNSLSTVGSSVLQAAFYERIGPLFLKALALILPTWLISLLISPAKGASRWVFLLYSFSFLVLTTIQNTRYFGYNNPLLFEVVGMTWAPRVFYGYSFVTAYTLLVLLMRRLELPRLRTNSWWAVLMLLILVEFPITQYCRSVDVDFIKMFQTVIKRRPVDKPEALVDANDLAKIRKIAKDIPDKSDVFVFDYLTTIFHKHHLIWLTGKEFEKADIAILPKTGFEHLKNNYLDKQIKHPYQKIEIGLKGYDVYVTPSYLLYFERFR